MGLIPREKIELIKQSFDIVDVVSERVQLKKSGQNFKGLCPFHSEKTSSFVVSPAKQIYHCFGCGEGGNVIQFISKMDNINFFEAVKVLAQKKGIPLDAADKAGKDEFDELFKVNELAVRYYKQKLQENKAAREYLAKRKLSQDTIEKFGLGYAPDEWEGLLNYAGKNGVPALLLEKAGLCIKRDKKEGHYDRFRNRIIFPIVSSFGKYVAFGARVMDAGLPKYINSPETPVYSKGKNLYAWNLARVKIPEDIGIIVVEGYLDCITCHQYGITNTVATLGTSLTREQAALLKRYTDKVVIAYDLDAAGINASLRGIAVLVEAGLDVKVAVFTGSKDPDEYLNVHGKDAFSGKVKEAKSIVDFWLDSVKPEALSDLKGKLNIFNQMLPVISAVNDDARRAEYKKAIAGRMNLPEKVINEAIEKHYEKIYNMAPAGKNIAVTAGKKIRPPVSRTELTEKQLLILALSDIETAKRVKKEVFPEDFNNGSIRRIIELLFEYCEKKNILDYTAMVEELDGETRRLFTELILDKVEYSSESRTQAEKDLIEAIRNGRIEKRLKELEVEIKKLNRGDGDKDLVNEYLQLQRHLKGKKVKGEK